jgi:subtilisin family serine protease
MSGEIPSSLPQKDEPSRDVSRRSLRSVLRTHRVTLVVLASLAIGLIAVVVIRYRPRPLKKESVQQANAEASKAKAAREPGPFVPGECIIQYKDQITADQRVALREKFKAQLMQNLKQAVSSGFHAAAAESTTGGLELVTFGEFTRSSAQSEAERKKIELDWIKKISQDPSVEFAEPNYIFHKADQHFVSNDPYYLEGKLWALKGDSTTFKAAHAQRPPSAIAHHPPTGGNGRPKTSRPPSQSRFHAAAVAGGAKGTGTINAVDLNYTVHADQAWATGHIGSKNTYVAVLDSGIQYTHPDLAANIATDLSKDFYDKPSRAQLFAVNEDPHGTHIAGIIGAVGGNQIGVAGVVWQSKLIEAKVLGPDGSGNAADMVRAIDYLTALKLQKKIDIVAINASFEGSDKSDALLGAIKRAGQADILFIAAAGNGGLDDDKYDDYPSVYDTTNDTSDGKPGIGYDSVISVAATNEQGALASISNFGAYTVHLAAPGTNIWSTWPTNTYMHDDGTSMAAAYVTGAVALYRGSHPKATAREIREAILVHVTKDPQIRDKVQSGGTLNVSSF